MARQGKCQSKKETARSPRGERAALSFSFDARSELAAQRHAISPRFGEELREDLASARILRVGEGGAGRCRAFLEGRVERDLRKLLVEQILRPPPERQTHVGAAHPKPEGRGE